MRIDLATNKRGGPKGLQYMLDKLGGLQLRYYCSDDELQSKMASADEIDTAYDFITSNGPRTNGPQLLQNRWIKKQHNDQESPLVKASFNARVRAWGSHR